ncbi:MAG: hypothetical protein ACKVVT_00255 [Dehalococcoidia bacterium]
MDGELPGPPPAPRRSPSAWPRGWLSFESYLLVHDQRLDALYREGLLESDDLVFERQGDRQSPIQIKLSADLIQCRSGVRARVLKWMAVRDGLSGIEVLTVFYQYQAWRVAESGPSAPLVRYDQAHGRMHVHRFDAVAGEYVEDLDIDHIPRLDDFLREAVDIADAFDARVTP